MAEDLMVNEIYQHTMYCECGDQVALTVRHWRITEVNGTGQTDVKLLEHLDDTFAPLLRAAIPTVAKYLGSKLQRLVPTKLISISQVTGAGFGSWAGDPAPRQAAGLVSLRTRNAGPKYRGRMFIPFPGEGANDVTGNPTAAYLDVIEDIGMAASTVQTVGIAPDTVKAAPVIFHRSSNTSDFITGFLERKRWGTQRRRSGVAGGDALPL